MKDKNTKTTLLLASFLPFILFMLVAIYFLFGYIDYKITKKDCIEAKNMEKHYQKYEMNESLKKECVKIGIEV